MIAALLFFLSFFEKQLDFR